MYTVIGATKTRAMRVMWLLQELGQDYTQIPAAPQSDEARAHNPTGKIPALVDGDAVLTDSLAIMTYLCDKHGALTAPAGTPERARQDAMTNWLIDEFDATLWSAAKHTFALPTDMREAAVIPAAQAEFARSATWLEEHFKGPFLMGDAFTLPDVLAVHCLGWAFGAGFPPAGERLKDYVKMCRARPAFRAAVAQGA